jgi:hypothetical protein
MRGDRIGFVVAGLAALAACDGDDGPTTCFATDDCPQGQVCAEDGFCNATGLSDRELVARWFIDEAAAGIAPVQLEDSAADPLALPVVYGTDASFTDRLGNRGLALRGQSEGSLASASIVGTKLSSALDESGQFTIELVVEVDRLVDDSATVFHVGSQDDTDLLIQCNRGDTLLEADGSRTAWPLALAGSRRVLHIVVDAPAPALLERVKLYSGGSRKSGGFGDMLTTGFDLSLASGAAVSLANRPSGDDSFAGVVFYAAVYGAALTDAEVAAHARRLAASDDR